MSASSGQAEPSRISGRNQPGTAERRGRSAWLEPSQRGHAARGDPSVQITHQRHRNRSVTVGSGRDGLHCPNAFRARRACRCSRRPRRSRSRPRCRAAPPTGRSSGSSSMATTRSSDRYKGATARWYREAVANPEVTIHAAGRRAARPARIAAVDPDSIRRMSDGLVRKYAGRGGLEPMLHARRPRHDPPTDTELTAMYFDEFKHQLPDIDPAETDDWIDLARPGRRRRGRGPRPVHHLQAAQARPPAPGRAPAADPDPLHQHDQPGTGAGLPGRRGDGAAHPPAHPLERGGDGPPREQPVLGDRRPPRHVRVGGDAVRGRLQPLLPRQGRRRERRPDLLPGPRRARDLRPRVPRGPAVGRPARPLPARDRARARACRPTRIRG